MVSFSCVYYCSHIFICNCYVFVTYFLFYYGRYIIIHTHLLLFRTGLECVLAVVKSLQGVSVFEMDISKINIDGNDAHDHISSISSNMNDSLNSYASCSSNNSNENNGIISNSSNLNITINTVGLIITKCKHLLLQAIRLHTHFICTVAIKSVRSLGDLHLVDKIEQDKKKKGKKRRMMNF